MLVPPPKWSRRLNAPAVLPPTTAKPARSEGRRLERGKRRCPLATVRGRSAGFSVRFGVKVLFLSPERRPARRNLADGLRFCILFLQTSTYISNYWLQHSMGGQTGQVCLTQGNIQQLQIVS